MNFNEELNRLSKRIDERKDKVRNEQGTIQSFILPFIKLLGYDHSDPAEVEPQYTAGFGAD